MTSDKIQKLLAMIFILLGGWALLMPGMVEALAIRPEFQANSLLSRVLVGCFGAQAVLTGLALFLSRLSVAGFVVFGLLGSLPFIAFNYYFFFTVQLFSVWMLLDFVGNVGILALCLTGAWKRRAENATA